MGEREIRGALAGLDQRGSGMSEREWLRRYHRHGDNEAFRQLFGHYRERIWKLILTRSVPQADAAIVLQDVAVAFAFYLKKQLPDHCSGLIYKIAHNKIADYFRKTGPPAMPLEVADGQVDSERNNPMKALENQQEVHQMLFQSGINEKQRQALVLHYYQGYSAGEVATILGIPEETVKSRLYLARKTIRAYLEKKKVRP